MGTTAVSVARLQPADSTPSAPLAAYWYVQHTTCAIPKLAPYTPNPKKYLNKIYDIVRFPLPSLWQNVLFKTGINWNNSLNHHCVFRLRMLLQCFVNARTEVPRPRNEDRPRLDPQVPRVCRSVATSEHGCLFDPSGRPNFGGLVLGCIDALDSEIIFVRFFEVYTMI